MKCVILCAGYGTGLYPVTLNVPKALLEVGGKPVLNYTIDKVLGLWNVDEVFVVTNGKFYGTFLAWKEEFYPDDHIDIINDETKSNEERLGGLGDLKLVLNTEEIEDDLLLILGDNLFDFDLGKIVDFFKKQKKNVIGLYDIKNLEKARNFNVLRIDDSKKIISFREKSPKPDSTLISAGIYIYSKDELDKIYSYMETKKPREEPDYLIPYFKNSQDVYGLVMEGKWACLGRKEDYEDVIKGKI